MSKPILFLVGILTCRSLYYKTNCVFYRCYKNCKGKASTDEAVVLRLIGGSTSNLTVTWSIYPPINWTRDSGSGNTGYTLTIYGNVLQPATLYTVNASGESQLSRIGTKLYM